MNKSTDIAIAKCVNSSKLAQYYAIFLPILLIYSISNEIIFKSKAKKIKQFQDIVSPNGLYMSKQECGEFRVESAASHEHNVCHC